jgi:hypothetical protein
MRWAQAGNSWVGQGRDVRVLHDHLRLRQHSSVAMGLLADPIVSKQQSDGQLHTYHCFNLLLDGFLGPGDAVA